MSDYLQATDIRKSYKNKEVLKGVSLTVKKGEVVALLGPNGAGKTTFFYSLVGLISISSGKILLKDRDITKYPMYLRGRIGIGYLPQENSIFREMTVAENISSILELKVSSRKERNQELDRLLQEFGLEKLRDSSALSLSGGERRRVEIARCLATYPDFILLDEPFAGVDPVAIGDIRNLVKKLITLDIGIVITDHNVRETLEIVDRAYIMYDGKILISGTTEEIVNNKEVQKVYLGENFNVTT